MALVRERVQLFSTGVKFVPQCIMLGISSKDGVGLSASMRNEYQAKWWKSFIILKQLISS